MYIRAIIDIVDPDITYGSATAQSENTYSKSAQLHGKDFSEPAKYATLEQDRWLLDGTFQIYPDSAAGVTDEMGYLSNALSGSDGAFSTAQWVQLNFSGCSILQACSVWFPNNDYDGVPEDFTIEVMQDGTAYATKTVTGNTESNVGFDGFTVYDPDAIRITVTKMSKAYRRFRCIEIVPGIYESWTEDIICELAVKQQVNFACTALPYGTATLKMENQSRRFEPRSKSGLFQSLEERQGIPISLGVELADGAIDWQQVGVFYQFSGGWRTGDNGLTMQWSLVDILGLLANRAYTVPTTLPTTLSGWIASAVSQLGTNFSDHYTVDASYSSTAVTASSAADVTGKKCGDIILWACMAAGVWPRADAETGYVAAEPLWNQGNYLTLDNMSGYPGMKANNDLAAVVFKLFDGNGTTYTVSGNSTASSQTVSVSNPFIHTEAAALVAARNILTMYGGNVLTVKSRGDMSSECGDVASVQLDESQATSARLLKQEFSFNSGVLKDLSSELLQASGYALYQNRVLLTSSQTWTAPSGVTSLRVILVGGGNGGTDGTDGGWDAAGTDGTDGTGGKVFSDTISINSGQSFAVTIGAAGQATTFGAYSSASGSLFNGYTDINDGAVFGRDGVAAPAANSGDGGAGGTGGSKGRRHETSDLDIIIDAEPGVGTAGAVGASGCVVIYYDKVVSA